MIMRFLSRAILAIETMIAQLFHMEGRGFVSPRKIRNEVELAARDIAARGWGDGSISYPDCYQLSLDSGSWNCYYGKRISETQQHVKEIVERFAAHSGGKVDQDVIVTLMPDESLRPNTVLVKASYAYKNQVSLPPNPTKPTNEEPKPVKPNRGTELHPANKSACLVSPVFPRPIKITSGDSIGVARYSDVPLPDIQLPDSAETAGISHLHATFNMSADGTWSISSKGMNGTSVVREGVSRKVDYDTPYGLRSGDVIVLANAENASLTVLIGLAANEAMRKGGRG